MRREVHNLLPKKYTGEYNLGKKDPSERAAIINFSVQMIVV